VYHVRGQISPESWLWYCADDWGNDHPSAFFYQTKVNILTLWFQAFIALAIDLAEVIGTANGSRRIPRAHPGLTFFIDFVVMIFFLVGFLMLFLSDFGESSKPRPWLDAVSEMLIIECLSL
jgi:Mn2+/Fe2+ NRAMP family transporter